VRQHVRATWLTLPKKILIGEVQQFTDGITELLNEMFELMKAESSG